MDKNNLPVKICSDCEKDSNMVDFHMKKGGTPCYYSKRCKTCQNKYRISLKTRGTEEKTCIDCGTKNSDGNFDYCSLPEKKVFHSRCKDCEEKLKETVGPDYITERFCWICEESSNNKEFRSKKYYGVGKVYYNNHCNDCEKKTSYKKTLEKYELDEINCKFCGVSSLTNKFGQYNSENKVVLYPYCFKCTYKATGSSIIICNVCDKNSDEVEFIPRDVSKGSSREAFYYNTCKKCVNVKRKKEYNKIEPKLKSYIRKATNRNYEWKLTDDEASDFFKGNCFYCDKISIMGEDMNGIDRVDNKLGYTPENCVSCCGMCNFMKNDYSKEEFIGKCTEISKHDSSKKIKEMEKTIDDLRNEISKLNGIKKEIFIYKHNPWNPDGPDTKYTVGKTSDKISEDKILFRMSCKNPILVEESVIHKLKICGNYSNFETIKEIVKSVINFIDT